MRSPLRRWPRSLPSGLVDGLAALLQPSHGYLLFKNNT
jgi:hypothetical protein